MQLKKMWVCYLMFLVACFGHLSYTLDPASQAKISVAFDTAAHFIEAAEKHYKDVGSSIAALDKSKDAVQLFAKQKNALKMVKMLGPILKSLGAASAVASFMFTFLMPTELEVAMKVINKRFDEVNLKLDGMSNKMDRLAKEIKSSINLNTFLVNYVEWESDINNVAVKLRETRKKFTKTPDEHKRLKLSEEFINYYDDAKVHGRMLNIFRMVHDPPSATHKNIFALFIHENGCDVNMLAKLYLYLQNLYTLAVEQTITYYHFKGMLDDIENSFEDMYDRMYDMRHSFDEFVFRCRKNSITYAKKEVVDILDKNPDDGTGVLADKIFKTLSAFFPWYSWAVAFTDENVNKKPSYRSNPFSSRTRPVLELQNKGNQFFKILKRGEKKRSVVVVWQYVNENPKCVARDISDNVVFYKSCDGCNSESFKASENILSKSSCSDTRFKSVDSSNYVKGWGWHSIQGRKRKFLKFYDSYDWIAVVQYNHNPCDYNTCKNDGMCRTIPGTSQFQCICRNFYDGKHCEEKFSVDNEINDIIATLRNDFGTITGVPTVVDLFFQLRDVSHNLDTILQNIKRMFALNNVIAQHSRVINLANYLAKKYARLSKYEISVAAFVRDMESFLDTESFDVIYERLYEIITGQGFLDNGHFLAEYKTYIAGSEENYVCTTNYANKIDDLSKDLLLLDHAIMEAYLVFLQAKANSASETEKQILLAQAKKRSNGAGYRARDYLDLWHRTSCPRLETEDMVYNACNNISSHLGMTVHILCNSSNRVPSVDKVSCVMENNVLKWSEEPTCDYFWEEWQPWERCNVTCDSGIHARHRNCSGPYCIGESKETGACHRESCCQEKFGMWKCHRQDKCVSILDLCNSKDQCRDRVFIPEEVQCPLIHDPDYTYEDSWRKKSWDANKEYYEQYYGF